MRLLDNYLERSIETFNSFDKSKPIRIIASKYPDGVCAAAILCKLFTNLDMTFSLSFIRYVKDEFIKQLSYEKYSQYIFVGIGEIQNLDNKKILILNNGITNISALTYYFAKEIDESIKELSHIALIGSQNNKEIIEDATSSGKIKIKHGLKFFDIYTRPLYKILQLSTNPYIPGITGSETGAIKFLESIGINPKKEDGWIMAHELSEGEIAALITNISKIRGDNNSTNNLTGPIYIITNEDPSSPTSNANEFLTLIDACIRMNKVSYAIGTCLNDKEIKAKAISLLRKYRNEVINALKWFEINKDTSKVITDKGFAIINYGDSLQHTLSGTIASLLGKTNLFSGDTIVITMAHYSDNKTKISLRFSRDDLPKNFNLRDIIKEIISDLEVGEAGGNREASGAIIPSEKEEEFINIAKETLSRKVMEEIIA